jgi:MarR family transcriptional regulator, multiple antibiotic resistance protein MarR
MNQAEQLDAAIGALVRRLIIDERRLSANLDLAPFTALDLETLSFVQRNPGKSAKDAAGFLGVRATTMQSVIDRLHKRGLLHRDTTALKGRAVALQLTADGEALRSDLHRQNLGNCSQMLQCLDQGDRADFIRNMAKIAAGFA